MRLVFASRLTWDKGADLILKIAQKKEFQHIEIHIFGLGEYETKFVEVSKKNNNLIFHGLQPRIIVQNYIKDTDMVLMPSRVMESFGLSALDAWTESKPVFVRNQGGLKEFYYDGLGFDSDDEFEIKLLESIKLLSQPGYLKQFESFLTQILPKYSKKIRLQKIQSDYFGFKIDNILVISDYIYPFGGIENYVIDVNRLLCETGLTSHLVGNDLKPSNLSRKLDLFLTCCNVYDMLHIRNKIREFKPQTIFLHSFSRRLGILPLFYLFFSKIPVVVMLHDFALFTAYPSKIIHEKQLNHLGTWKYQYLTAITSLSKFVEVCLKYISNIIYLSFLKQSNRKILVPSEFMKEPIEIVMKKRIGVLNHFSKSL